jgi:hypothetical protein
MNRIVRLAILAGLSALLVIASHAQAPYTPPIAAPVWVTVTAESATIEVTLPAGTIYRVGDYTNNLWSASITAAELGATFDPLNMGLNAAAFPFADPDPGVAKELDVLEIAGTQAVTVSDLTLVPLAPIQRIIPGLVPATSVTTAPGTQHTLTFSNFANDGTNPAALALLLVNAPANLANVGWVGTQMELDIDGVAFTCTYGQTYTDQVFTLSCTVPAAP